MDRLLSDDEFLAIEKKHKGSTYLFNHVCYAQDRKTAAAVNAEWVAWIETLDVGKSCMETECKFWQECIAVATTDCLAFQRRKKEIGI